MVSGYARVVVTYLIPASLLIFIYFQFILDGSQISSPKSSPESSRTVQEPFDTSKWDLDRFRVRREVPESYVAPELSPPVQLRGDPAMPAIPGVPGVLSFPGGPLLVTMAEVGLFPPHTPPSDTCKPPTLPSRPSCLGQPGLTGKLLEKPRKLVMMMMFGFEVDTIEIALQEQLELVDHMFIVESTVTHKGQTKPLIWDRLKFYKRFRWVNQTKIDHVVVDDQLRREEARTKEWWVEEKQTDFGVARVKGWAEESQGLSPDDLFISTNVDEVLSRETLHQLRWCETKYAMMSGALWMPLGRLDQALRTDRPVKGRPHTWANPSIYRWREVAQGNVLGRRLFGPPYTGQEDNYLLGGVHLTKPASVQQAVMKELSATEKAWYPGMVNTAYLLEASQDTLDREQARLYELEDHLCWKELVTPLDSATDVLPFIPWYLGCNQQRFPYWFGSPDPRNGDLAWAMARVADAYRRQDKMHLVSGGKDRLFPTSYHPLRNQTLANKIKCEGRTIQYP